jgi:hypothetical protein
VQIKEAYAQATHMAARTDDTGVFRAVGLRVLTQVEQNAGLMRLLLCSAFKVDAFAALEGHALAHILFESKVHRLYAFLSGYIETRIADGVSTAQSCDSCPRFRWHDRRLSPAP